jgi:hypothetical protein
MVSLHVEKRSKTSSVHVLFLHRRLRGRAVGGDTTVAVGDGLFCGIGADAVACAGVGRLGAVGVDVVEGVPEECGAKQNNQHTACSC